MNTVEFHHGMSDKLSYACRLLRKAYKSGAGVLVTGDASTLKSLDRQLWVFDEQEFLPHVLATPGQDMPARLHDTPVWLAPHGLDQQAPGRRSILVNLGPEMPEFNPEGGQLLPVPQVVESPLLTPDIDFAPAPLPVPEVVVSSSSMVPLASIPHVAPYTPPEAIDPEVSEAQLSQRILTDVQRQIDSMLEFRLRESMQPLLAQFTETLMQDLRDELSRTMRDVVTRAVAQEVAKLRNNR